MRKKLAMNKKRLLIILGLLALGAALAYAASELMGLASSLAQDAGSNGASLEMISVESIKKPLKTKEYPAGPPCDWGLEKNLREALQTNDRSFNQASAQAQRELKTQGQVSAGVRKNIMDLAREFQNLSNRYADMWDACKCTSRAKLAREAGAARMKTAVVVAWNQEKDDLTAMTEAQDKMRLARREYAIKVVEGDEIGPADKTDIKDRLLPMARRLLAQVQANQDKTAEMVWHVKAGLKGGGDYVLSGEQKFLINLGSAMNEAFGGMQANLLDLIDDLTAIVTGQMISRLSGGAGTGTCFIGASRLK